MLVHYYKTKCEVLGDERIQHDRKSAIIYLDWHDIG